MIVFAVRSIIFILLVSLINITHAAIPFTWIAGLHEVVQPRYSYLSLVNGLVWSSNNIVENMYRYGLEADATIKLIKELFYLQRDEVSFVPTVRDDKPAAHWGVRHIGKIVAIIQQYRTDNQFDTQACKAALQKVMIEFKTDPIMKEKAAKRLDLQQQLGETKVQPLTKAIQTLKSEQFKKVGSQNIRHLLTASSLTRYDALVLQSTVPGNVQQINQEITGLIKAEVQRLEQERQKAQKVLREDKDRAIKQRKLAMLDVLFADHTYASLASLIVDAVQESLPGDGQKYMSYTVEQILLAFAWVKANPREQQENPKQDVLDFFEPLVLYVDPEQLAAWSTKAPYSVADHVWCREQIKKLGNQAPVFLMSHYPLAVFSVAAHRSWDQPLPMIVRGKMAYYTDPAGNRYEFPDCAETSLRNFFDIVLRDRDTNVFSTDYLFAGALSKSTTTDALALKPDSRLINFYKKYSSITNLTAQSLYDAWTQVVENIDGVKYLQCEAGFRYEIKPGLGNMLQLLNVLLFGNAAEFSTLTRREQLNLVCQKLSRNNFTLSWTVQDDANIEKEEIAELVFTVKTKIDSTQFRWKFQQNHVVLSGPAQTSYPIEREQIKALAATFNTDHEHTPIGIYNLLSNYLTLQDIGSILAATQSILRPRELSALVMAAVPLFPKVSIAKVLYPFFTDNEVLRNMMCKIAEEYIAANPHMGADVFLSLITDEYNDRDTFKTFVEYLINHVSQPQIADEIIEYIFNERIFNEFDEAFIIARLAAVTSPGSATSIAQEIMQNNLTQYVQIMQNTLARIKNLPMITIVASNIIDHNYRPWLDLVRTWIEGIADEDIVHKLIVAVLYKDRVTLFDSAKKRAAKLSVEARADLCNVILTQKIASWYDFVGGQILLWQDNNALIEIATYISKKKIRPFFEVMRKKLSTVTKPDLQNKIQELMQALQ